jgi:hypothetical protein
VSPRYIRYPSSWTLAVIDEPSEARAAVEELRASGVPDDDLVLLSGADAVAQLDRLGTSRGMAARLRRTVQFLTMDQMPDLHVYELAIEREHPVVGVRVADAEARGEAIDIIRRHGGHFINRFGAWATEEIAPWRGPMPPLPQHLQR